MPAMRPAAATVAILVRFTFTPWSLASTGSSPTMRMTAPRRVRSIQRIRASVAPSSARMTSRNSPEEMSAS